MNWCVDTYMCHYMFQATFRVSTLIQRFAVSSLGPSLKYKTYLVSSVMA